MSYKLSELAPVGESFTSGGGDTLINTPLNAGPNIRVYLYADGLHDDPTDRILGLHIVTDGGAFPVAVAASRTVVATPNDIDRIFLPRPVFVHPTERLRLSADAMATAATMKLRAVYVEIPVGQSIEGVF